MRTAIKTVLLFIVGVCVLLFSCKKEKDDPPEKKYIINRDSVQKQSAVDMVTGVYSMNANYVLYQFDPYTDFMSISRDTFTLDSVQITKINDSTLHFDIGPNNLSFWTIGLFISSFDAKYLGSSNAADSFGGYSGINGTSYSLKRDISTGIVNVQCDFSREQLVAIQYYSGHKR